MSPKTLIFIPTFNERDNVVNIYRQIKALNVSSDILFLDDNSPDGTGDIIDKITKEDPRVFVIHRKKKSGIGSAHLDGIQWAYDKNYIVLITMDCDFSHSPNYILDFLKYGAQYDVVVGSRYMQEGSLKDWSLIRKILTHVGHFLTDKILGMPYDATGAFRLYRLDIIPAGVFSLVKSWGYSFFFESLYILHLNKFSIKEFPIDLPVRTYGHSKMNFKDVMQSVWRLIDTCRKSFLNRKLYIYTAPIQNKEFVADSKVYVKGGMLNAAQVQQEWDQYWKGKKSANVLYDIIAEFYRKCIIKRTLNRFIQRTFPRNSKILHAGCGSGQVDTDVVQWAQVTALDISIHALNIYQKIHKNSCTIIHGDIFHLPGKNEYFDGIYNLGVMEHFTKDEIHKILEEFHRVLKPQGKILFFWPPEFGLTVRVLDSVHYVLNKVLKKNIKLHPDEITRVKSKQQMTEIFSKAGFKMEDYYFGPQDFFTHVIMVLSKDDIKVGVK